MDVISTKTETSSPSNTVDPKSVVCPTCNSPIGAKCLNDEAQTVEWFHLSRISAAIDALPTGTTIEPEPEPPTAEPITEPEPA